MIGGSCVTRICGRNASSSSISSRARDRMDASGRNEVSSMGAKSRTGNVGLAASGSRRRPPPGELVMVHRREMLVSLVAGLAAGSAGSMFPAVLEGQPLPPPPPPRVPRLRSLRSATGAVDWHAVRELFPLAPDWTHLSSFLFVSHPKPVAEAIDRFRKK